MIVLGVFQRLFGVLTVVFGLVITTSDCFGRELFELAAETVGMITACLRVAVPDGASCAPPKLSEMPLTMV